MRLLPDAALPPELAVPSFFEEHLTLILCLAAGVAVITVLLIVLLKKKNKHNKGEKE